LIGVLYDRTDQPWLHLRRRPGAGSAEHWTDDPSVKTHPAGLCVATHFLPAEIIAWLIAKRKLHARHAIVVTDYDVHAMWLCRTVDRCYCTFL